MSDAKILRETTKLSKPINISLPNGEKAKATIIGDVKLNDSISLKRALRLPELNCNLISISKLT